MEKIAYYSKLQKYNFIKKYKDSNLTASAFCRENGLNVGTFKYWMYTEGWKYSDEQMAGFVELGQTEIKTDLDKSVTIKKAGIEIKVPAEIAERNLVKILDAVAMI